MFVANRRANNLVILHDDLMKTISDRAKMFAVYGAFIACRLLCSQADSFLLH